MNPSLSIVQTRIDSIISSFKDSVASTASISQQKYYSATCEATESPPFLVICPSDLITIVKALFPERRLTSNQLENTIEISSVESTASSISGTPGPFRMVSDGSSVLSLGASSVTSENTSREPVFDCSSSGNRSSWTDEDCHSDTSKVQPTEQWGRRLRSACSALARGIGVETCAGSCHPCAERWAVLYVSPHGGELTTQLPEEASDGGTVDAGVTDRLSSYGYNGCDKSESKDMANTDDFLFLKDAITKLLNEHELPMKSGYENGTTFTHRSSVLRRSAKSSYHVRTDAAGQEHISRAFSQNYNYDPSNIRAFNGSPDNTFRSIHRSRSTTIVSPADEQYPEGPSVLMAMLETAIHQCKIHSDFLNAHLFFKALKQLRKLLAPPSTYCDYTSLLNRLATESKLLLDSAARTIESLATWSGTLEQTQNRQNDEITEVMRATRLIRDKMWYITDVRHSRCYEDARNIVWALKTMGQPNKAVDGRATLLSDRGQRMSDTNFLTRPNAQYVSLLAAPVKLGGPRKLSDQQSDMTYSWLTEHKIENFCKAEERIHRFCLEINKCVNKLLGDGMLQGPVLWSSELYSRERDIFDHGQRDGLLSLSLVDALGLAGEEKAPQAETTQCRAQSLDFSSRVHRSDLRTNFPRDGFREKSIFSQHKVEPSEKVMEVKDLFNNMIPLLTTNSIATLWSPVSSHSDKRTLRSTSSQRPRTAAAPSASTTSSTARQKSAAPISEEKHQFLNDLRRKVVELLLSDLGVIVFPHGSETDDWFSGDIGYACLQRKEGNKTKVLEETETETGSRTKDANADKFTDSTLPDKQLQLDVQRVSFNNEEPIIGNLTTGIATMTPLDSVPGVTDSNIDSHVHLVIAAVDDFAHVEFSYQDAFRHLLDNFSINPSPFKKLRILYELEQLIIASLTSLSDGTRKRTPASSVSDTSRLRNLGSAPSIAEATITGLVSTPTSKIILEKDASALEDDDQESWDNITNEMIIDVYVNLFRDPISRPKQLFRDLQYIAAFISADTLERTAYGQALWNAGLAALYLKQNVCQMMVEMADDIVAYNTQKRNASLKSASTTSRSESTSDHREDDVTEPMKVETSFSSLSRYTMADAAAMLLITAKEGHAVAERELATFYLSEPDLLPLAIAPLTRPRDVFKPDLVASVSARSDSFSSNATTGTGRTGSIGTAHTVGTGANGSGSNVAGRTDTSGTSGRTGARGKSSGESSSAAGSGGNHGAKDEKARSDPVTMCVAQHWMELSARGGDRLARTYLRAKDEMERIPSV